MHIPLRSSRYFSEKMLYRNRKLIIGTTCIGIGGLIFYYTNRSEESQDKSIKSYFGGKLVNSKVLSNNSKLLTFEVKNKEILSRFNTLSHIYAIDNGNIYRSYTPIYIKDHIFSIYVKSYPDGYFSRILHSMKLSTNQVFYGPIKTLDFNLNQKKIKNVINNQEYEDIETIYCITTGTGISPILQLLSDENIKGQFNIKLLHFVKTLSEKHTIETLLNEYKDKITIKCKEERNSLISKENIQKFLINVSKDSSVILVCGTDSFVSKICGNGHEDGNYMKQPELSGILSSLGFKNNQVFRL